MSGTDGRPATARAARLVAMSLGGGAAITLLGASTAQADDADATGNKASTGMTQTIDGAAAQPTVVDLDGHVGNVGVAGANTGVNTGDGDGITPGDATAGGNRSASTLDQKAKVSGGGGGPVVISEDGRIVNAGFGLANTGFNTGGGIATGNAWSLGNDSTSGLLQDVTASSSDLGLVVISQTGSIVNLGGAIANTGFNEGESITTGNAKAAGDVATTHTAQVASEGGAFGAAVVDQRSRTRNAGFGRANTGHNLVIGDDSENFDELTQVPEP